MGIVIDIKSGANKSKRKYIIALVGQALHEGADQQAILAHLTSQGVLNPEEFITIAKGKKTYPKLGRGELFDLGGRGPFRQLFGLDPDASPSHMGRALLAEDFVAYLPDHSYFCVPTREFWDARSITEHVQAPTEDLDGKPCDLEVCVWLDRYRHVEQLSWCPGREMLVKNLIIADGGWITREGMTVLNLYRPPTVLVGGDPEQAGRWVQMVQRMYPHDSQHLIPWYAHRIQRPWEKVNHAIVLGGSQGIGKDTMLMPVRIGVGEWNCSEIGPTTVMGRFNGHLKSIMVRVNEVHDLGDINRYQFYERTKGMIASPPEVFRIDEKNLREHVIPNVCGVILTTNHKDSGMYLPPEDRRHYVAWSDLEAADTPQAAWDEIHHWYEHDHGIAHVVAYLSDPARLVGFDPKAPPPKTEAWHQIVNANLSPEQSEIADLIDLLHGPDVVTLDDLIKETQKPSATPAVVDFGRWLGDRKNRRMVPHRLESCGYVAVRNPDDKRDGQWKVDGRRQLLYVKKSLPATDRMAAARSRVGARTEVLVPSDKIPF